MAAFQIELKHLERNPVEKDFRPGEEALRALFDDISDDFRLTNFDDFHAQIRAQMSDSTVHINGEAKAQFEYKCGRCLGPQTYDVDTEIDFVLMSEAEWSSSYAGHEEIELSEADLDVNFYTGDSVDIGELIREAILLQLPAFPRCPSDISDKCDARYNERIGTEALEVLEENSLDLRMSAFRQLEIAEDGKLRKKGNGKKSD